MASATLGPPGCGPRALCECSTSSSGGLTERSGSDAFVVMRPLRSGVNALVPASAFASLREVLGRPVHLHLHEHSAGGTYMVRLPGLDHGPVRAVFKPRAEEIGQPRNPHGNRTSERAAEFVPGSGSRREVLAFLLDHERSAGVVPTVEACAVPAAHSDSAEWDEAAEDETGVGALLLFVPGCVEAADVLPGEFAVEEVHRIAILDIRTLNGDRHGGNVLVYTTCDDGNNNNKNNNNKNKKKNHSGATHVSQHLVPIDHSYICPAGFADPDFEWLSWPQAKVPFSQTARRYIARLDEDRDAAILRAALCNTNSSTNSKSNRNSGDEGDDEDEDDDDAYAAEEVLRCTTRLLRVAALEYGMSAHDIGQLCRRRTLATPSVLEELMGESRDDVWHVQYERFEELLHALLRSEGQTRVERESESERESE